MFVVGATPSGGVIWLALLRDGKVGGAPPARPPAWALPCSASPSSPPRSPFSVCMFQVSSVNPRWYDQSCMRLCPANRFASAALMSFSCGVANTSGLHFDSNHWLVHGYWYSRVGLGAAGRVPIVPLARLSHFSK